MKLLIADDEIDVREGIRYLLDWQSLGFVICGEGKNGQDTLEQILKLQPDVVLMDIRMPKLSGLEVVKSSIEQGFSGKFIIISGYSDFAYAKEAIHYGVTNYLTKPIDEDELLHAVTEAKEALEQEQEQLKKLIVYRDKARESILSEIILNQADYLYLDYHDLILESPVYQIVLYTNYNQESFQTAWDFADILRLANKNHNSLDHIVLNRQDVILLKGDFALKRFQELVAHHIRRHILERPHTRGVLHRNGRDHRHGEELMGLDGLDIRLDTRAAAGIRPGDGEDRTKGCHGETFLSSPHARRALKASSVVMVFVA